MEIVSDVLGVEVYHEGLNIATFRVNGGGGQPTEVKARWYAKLLEKAMEANERETAMPSKVKENKPEKPEKSKRSPIRIKARRVNSNDWEIMEIEALHHKELPTAYLTSEGAIDQGWANGHKALYIRAKTGCALLLRERQVIHHQYMELALSRIKIAGKLLTKIKKEEKENADWVGVKTFEI